MGFLFRSNRDSLGRSGGERDGGLPDYDWIDSDVTSDHKEPVNHSRSSDSKVIEFLDTASNGSVPIGGQAGIEEAEVRIVKCKACGSKNRVKIHRTDILPVCGKCRSPLTSGVEPINLLKDINDAFTGEPIDLEKEVFQCGKCKVYYYRSSLDVIRKMNNGSCVSCGKNNIVRISNLKEHKRGVNVRPPAVTIDNYRDYLGRVVTFEGYVPRVEMGQSGKFYAIMFENKSFRDGLKILVLRQYLELAGGVEFLRALQGKIVRVKGLLTKHPEYGEEILVADRNMILEIR